MTKFSLAIVLFLSTMPFSQLAKPTSIQSIDFETLIDQSEFIFDGAVTKVEPRWNDDNTVIHSYVSFRIAEVIKGQYEGEQITLRFAGGEIGDNKFVYQGMTYPAINEKGIYFVETLHKNLINPLVGWSQGHYLIDDNKMMTNLGEPVEDVQVSIKVSTGELSHGAVAGARLGQKKEHSMSVTSFKNKIRTIMD